MSSLTSVTGNQVIFYSFSWKNSSTDFFTIVITSTIVLCTRWIGLHLAVTPLYFCLCRLWPWCASLRVFCCEAVFLNYGNNDNNNLIILFIFLPSPLRCFHVSELTRVFILSHSVSDLDTPVGFTLSESFILFISALTMASFSYINITLDLILRVQVKLHPVDPFVNHLIPFNKLKLHLNYRIG